MRYVLNDCCIAMIARVSNSDAGILKDLKRRKTSKWRLSRFRFNSLKVSLRSSAHFWFSSSRVFRFKASSFIILKIWNVHVWFEKSRVSFKRTMQITRHGPMFLWRKNYLLHFDWNIYFCLLRRTSCPVSTVFLQWRISLKPRLATDSSYCFPRPSRAQFKNSRTNSFLLPKSLTS